MRELDKYRRYAERIKIFHDLPPEEVDYILHHGKVRDYTPGFTIFHEGMMGSSLFIVFKGEIGIFCKNEMIAKCEVGDVFGEMSVLNHTPRCATASALTNARCFAIEEKEIQALLESKFAVTLLTNIVHVLSERLQTANSANLALRQQVKSLRALQQQS